MKFPRHHLLNPLAVLLFLGHLAGLSPAVAEDWPRFLGPRADNTSTETGLLEKFPATGPKILWELKIGPGYAAPSIIGEQLILFHRVGDEEIVQSLHAHTGKPGWRSAYPSHYQDPYGYNNGPRSTPLLTSNRCYTFGAEGKLLCLDLATGRLLWQRDTATDWKIPPAFFGVGSTPVLEGDKLIVMIGGQTNSGIVAFDSQTGKTLWESVGAKNWEGIPMTGWPGERKVQWLDWEKQASYASPVAATIHGRRHLLCLMRQGLVSLNPTNGDVHFSFWFRSRANDSVNAMNPVVLDDLILLSGAYQRVGSLLLRLHPDGKTLHEVRRDLSLEIHWTTPVLHQGNLYAFSGRNEPDARFRCVDFKTGAIRWDRDESWPPHSTPQPPVYGRGSAILADGKLITLGEGGLLGLFRLNPKKDEEISRWQLPTLRHPCWAAPVLAGKKLYLRSEDRLICLDLAK